MLGLITTGDAEGVPVTRYHDLGRAHVLLTGMAGGMSTIPRDLGWWLSTLLFGDYRSRALAC